jgi:D-lyxose ketol-isomerase
MITRGQLDSSRGRAAEMIRRAGVPITDTEAAKIEVADFGLSHLEIEGAQILTLVQTGRLGVKVVALFPGQALPEHWHPPVGEDEGKEETLRVLDGEVSLYIAGESAGPPVRVPEGKEAVYTARQETVMRRGDQSTLSPGTKHWFRAGPEGAVLFSFSSVARDLLDQFTDPEVQRATEVAED